MNEKLADNDHNATDTPQTGTFNVITQYLKDLSFESPHAPFSILDLREPPQLEVGINIELNPFANNPQAENIPDREHLFEVILSLSTKAQKADSALLFHVELLYAGLFLVKDIEEQHLRPLLAIEAPRLLFPFARQILSDATKNGGFPHVMLDPIDFANLYYTNLAKANPQAGTA
ncbi:protein-export chaperone SecB [Bartonella sp. TP]|uniref:protein-export chaperone SecB n=1 Tax=Bartonella sp. TP TaxID=3057550 RepID=UPI0025B0353E|nr:protein-export chaperone SecB [Bartonella sp. TP]MDN5248615.1 protein-export chaperone SecB [Alphaproteobacteria bacterium]WJW80430.1 protein-export chaperone SecB [Bartonella sp. TP]